VVGLRCISLRISFADRIIYQGECKHRVDSPIWVYTIRRVEPSDQRGAAMTFRQAMLLCSVTISGLACTQSGLPGPGSTPTGFALDSYESQSPVPIVVTSGGRSLFRLGASIGFLEGGHATATFRYRMDSSTDPEHVKVFSGTWAEGPSGLTVSFNGATTQLVSSNHIDRLTMTASWTDGSATLGGTFGFTRVYLE
jgi:hypothetical protein